MAVAARLLTYDDLAKTPEGDGNRYELLDGALVVTASPSKRHAWVVARLVRRLGAFVEEHDLGEVFGSPIDVRLSPHDVVVPDIVYLSKERFARFGEQSLDGAPDLIVEVLSPSTRERDLGIKRELYARYGVPEYWIVDVETSEVSVLQLNDQGDYVSAHSNAGVVRSRVLPGFTLDMVRLFANLS